MTKNPKKAAAPSPLSLPLHAADRKRLEAYASAFRTPPAILAAEVVRRVLRSLPPPPEQTQASVSEYLAAELTGARATQSALLKAAGEADAATSRVGTLIDLLEPALHRLGPKS